MAETSFKVPIDEELLAKMEAICEEIGITVNDALNVFARQFIAHRGFPFEVTDEELERAKREAAPRFKAQDYSYRVFWSEEDRAWISTSPEFKYLSNIDEDSQLGAFTGMVDLLQSVLDDIYGEGKVPPAPLWKRLEPQPSNGESEENEGPAKYVPFESEEEVLEFADAMFDEIMADES